MTQIATGQVWNAAAELLLPTPALAKGKGKGGGHGKGKSGGDGDSGGDGGDGGDSGSDRGDGDSDSGDKGDKDKGDKDNSSKDDGKDRKSDRDGESSDSDGSDGSDTAETDTDNRSESSDQTTASIDAANAARSSRSGGGVGPERSTIREHEVIAFNPSQATLTAALKLGMQINGAVELSDLKAAVIRLRLPASMTPEHAQAALAGTAGSGTIGLNRVYRLFAVAGDKPRAAAKAAKGGCDEGTCFNHAAIGWQESLAACSGRPLIGVLDTGVDLTHPALRAASVRTLSFTAPDMRPSPPGHGTAVLSLLAGDATGPVPGLLPRADYLVADIFSLDENGALFADTFSLLAGLEWVHRQGARIVNLSFSGPPDEMVHDKIVSMARSGVLLVAAAGNQGKNAPPSFPAAYPEVIAVTAVGRDLKGYVYANQGDYIDLAEPGVGVWTALPGGKVGPQSGTSFATPHAVAVLAALQSGSERSLQKEEALRLVSYRELGVPGPDIVFGRGLLLAPSTCPQVAPKATFSFFGATMNSWPTGSARFPSRTRN